MDGFFTTNGINCMGYYLQQDLPFYYSLFSDFTLCANYFYPVLGPTYPNRFYLVGGTSGGITNNQWGFGIFDYPIILDLLEDAGVSWKVYNTSWDPVPPGDSDNVFVFWKRWANDNRTRGSMADYLADLKHDRLPQAPQLDAYGLGFLVPTWVISPFAKKAHPEPTVYEHSSILKFIEAVFGLPTLASVNHRFDVSTPGTDNDAANGNPVGPPAPPRDGRRDIGDMLECFQF